MMQAERLSLILDKLNENGSVRVAELTKELRASEATIRRDIIELDKQGLLQKVFGGAVANTQPAKAMLRDMTTKAGLHSEEKLQIARYAASLIEDGEYVYLDAGTTTGAMISYLGAKNITIVTNGARHALELAAMGLNVYVLAGHMKSFTEAIVGSGAVEEVQKYRFSKCFMGVDAIDMKNGMTTSDMEESNIKRAAIACADEVFFLADSSKFDTVAPVRFASLGDGRILTEKKPPKAYRQSANSIEIAQ